MSDDPDDPNLHYTKQGRPPTKKTQKEVECPICAADLELDAGWKLGDQIYCTYCESELKLIKDKRSPDPEAIRATEDID